MTTDILPVGIPAGDMASALEASDPNLVINQLNALLRGEISAAETYRMAIDKVSQSDASAALGTLREIQEEHGRAAQAIRDRIRELSGQPSDASGAWGVWAKMVQGVADLFGTVAGLKTLKDGEEHGLNDYQTALGNVDLTSRQLIENQFIPAQQRHIGVLDHMITIANGPQ